MVMPSLKPRLVWKLWILTIDWKVGYSLLGIIIAVIVIIALYTMSVVGRVGHSGISALRGWYYAHRGLHGHGIAENGMTAFSEAKKSGYGIEFDVHLLKDGNLAVIHDSKLERTVGKAGRVEDLVTDDLSSCFLEGTNDTIPLFQEVLDLYNGEAPLIIELKTSGNNVAQLCENVCAVLDDYKGVFCLESFDPRCIYWLRKNRPDIIRGQLTENYFVSDTSVIPWFLKFALKNQIFNFLTYPDFVAYRFSDRNTISNLLVRKFWGVQGVTWTLKTKADFDTAVTENWIPIFEGFRP